MKLNNQVLSLLVLNLVFAAAAAAQPSLGRLGRGHPIRRPSFVCEFANRDGFKGSVKRYSENKVRYVIRLGDGDPEQFPNFSHVEVKNSRAFKKLYGENKDMQIAVRMAKLEPSDVKAALVREVKDDDNQLRAYLVTFYGPKMADGARPVLGHAGTVYGHSIRCKSSDEE